MPNFTLNIPIVPKQQKRHRARIAKSRAGKQFVQTYKAPDARNEEDNLRSMIHRTLPTDVLFPITTAIELSIVAFLPIPTSWSRKKWGSAMAGEIQHVSRPDTDNLCKSCLDCMSGVVFVDDRQIWNLSLVKCYSDRPGWSILVKW